MSTQERTLKNRMFKGIPGDQITWRHMEKDNNGLYGGNGVRYFAIKLDDDFAEELEAEGWPVIWRNVSRDDNEPEVMKGYLKVFIKYGTRFPVNIYLINKNMHSKTLIDEEDIDLLHLDTKPIEFVDLMVRPYYWVYGDKHGVKAQVQDMNILLSQDGLDDDYEIVYKA
jgi:hypothetical protein